MDLWVLGLRKGAERAERVTGEAVGVSSPLPFTIEGVVEDGLISRSIVLMLRKYSIFALDFDSEITRRYTRSCS